MLSGGDIKFGSILGYSEVITSTNTIMDKNPQWLEHLPNGFTITATTQIAGRGRGGNVWVNPRCPCNVSAFQNTTFTLVVVNGGYIAVFMWIGID